MADSLKTVSVTSDAWKAPVLINERDFDPAIHKRVESEPEPAPEPEKASEPTKRRGRPRKNVEESGNANG